MNIIMCFDEFKSMTGSPTYFFYLSKGLLELGHKVSIVAMQDHNSFYYKEAEKMGIKLYDKWDKSYKNEKFDFGIISQINNRYILDEINCLFINIVHSKFECEQPISHEKILGRLACREDVINVQQELLDFDGVLLNPIDLNKFKKSEHINSKYTILSLSTIDILRVNMITELVKRSVIDDCNLIVQGRKDLDIENAIIKRFGYVPKNIEFRSQTTEPEKAIEECDEIASLYFGRVALEGLAMGKIASIYQDDNSYELIKDYDMSIHDYKNIASKLLEYYKELIEKNTIKIVLVRYGKKEMEDQCIKEIKETTLWPIEIIDIDNMPLNEGLSTIWNRYLDNNYVLFANTDIHVTPMWLERMMQTAKQNEECGAVGPSGDRVFSFQGNRVEGLYNAETEVNFLSGYCILCKKTEVRFPEEVPFYYNDRAYSDLMIEAGYKLIHKNNSYVYHENMKSQSEESHSVLGVDGEKRYNKWNKNRKKDEFNITTI